MLVNFLLNSIYLKKKAELLADPNSANVDLGSLVRNSLAPSQLLLEVAKEATLTH